MSDAPELIKLSARLLEPPDLVARRIAHIPLGKPDDPGVNDRLVARYRDDGRLMAIHFERDTDYAERLAQAQAGATPPEGGYYREFPPARTPA